MIDVRLSKKVLRLQDCVSRFPTSNIGCVNFFIGKVRATRGKKTVLYLHFEAYESMALSEMERIAKDAKQKFDIRNILIYHRTGRVDAGEIPVIIGVAATHRRPAIQATQYLIDTFKKTVPIWKKEGYANGEVWVSAHP